MSVHIVFASTQNGPLPAGFSETLAAMNCTIVRIAPGAALFGLAGRVHVDAVLVAPDGAQACAELARIIRHIPTLAHAPVLNLSECARWDPQAPLDAWRFYLAVEQLLHDHASCLLEARMVTGPLSIDQSTRTTHAFGRALKLGPRQFDLLNYLIRRPNKVFHRSQLLAALWHGDHKAKPRAVDVNIMRLRQALIDANIQHRIRTFRDLGYLFDAAAHARPAGQFEKPTLSLVPTTPDLTTAHEPLISGI